jgi:hypothetical protein
MDRPFGCGPKESEAKKPPYASIFLFPVLFNVYYYEQNCHKKRILCLWMILTMDFVSLENKRILVFVSDRVGPATVAVVLNEWFGGDSHGSGKS